MDKRFPTPRDAGSASPEDVARALHRVLRTVDGRTRFVFHADFEYANGRRGPLVMVGALRGAWREYVRRNSGSSSFAAGECEVTRAPGGRPLLSMQPSHGRGANSRNARALNDGPMRSAGAEARFVESLGAAPAAEPAGAPAPEPDSVRADYETLLGEFEAFRKKPTAESLEALVAGISKWKTMRDALPQASIDAKASRRIEQMEKLLAEKGPAYVARAAP